MTARTKTRFLGSNAFQTEVVVEEESGAGWGGGGCEG